MNGEIYRIGISLQEINDALQNHLSEKEVGDFLHKIVLPFKVVNPEIQFITSIKNVLGKPYKRGASVLRDAPDAFDCSSLVSWAAVESGYAIPRISIDQYVYSQRINKTDLIPGDLVFANTQEIIHTDGHYFSQVLGQLVEEQPIRTETLEYKPGTQVPKGVDHVGVYVGGNKVIHASIKNGGVTEEDLNSSQSFKNIVGFGRIISNANKRFVIEIPVERKDMRSREGLINELKKLWQIQ